MTGIITAAIPEDTASVHDYLSDLLDEAHRHAALHHPLLRGLRTGAFADAAGVLRSFALHYNAYSAWFPRYLSAVIDRLAAPRHRELLRENLEEEKGRLEPDDYDTLRAVGIDPETVAGIPHSVLFRRFCTAMGITGEQLGAPPHREAARWRTKFLAFLRSASPAAAVGALGLGTESIVKLIYPPILEGIRRLGTLPREDYVFFELHCLVDEQHQQDLLAIAAELAATEQGRRDLRRGMLTALDLRRAFWDFLYAEARTLGEVA